MVISKIWGNRNFSQITETQTLDFTGKQFLFENIGESLCVAIFNPPSPSTPTAKATAATSVYEFVLCFHHQTFTKYQNERYLDIDKYSGKRSKHSSVSNVTFVVVHKRKFLGLISRFPLSIIWKNQKRKATTYVLGNKHWLKESVAIRNRLVIWLIPFFNYVDDTCKQEVW